MPDPAPASPAQAEQSLNWAGGLQLPRELRPGVLRAAQVDRRTCTNWVALVVEKELRRRGLLQPAEVSAGGGGK